MRYCRGYVIGKVFIFSAASISTTVFQLFTTDMGMAYTIPIGRLLPLGSEIGIHI